MYMYMHMCECVTYNVLYTCVRVFHTQGYEGSFLKLISSKPGKQPQVIACVIIDEYCGIIILTSLNLDTLSKKMVYKLMSEVNSGQCTFLMGCPT